MATRGRRQLAAIMFTDISGYTALMQRDERKAAAFRERHRVVLGRCVEVAGGEVVQHYGDGSLTVFESALVAVQCALEVQATLRDEPPVPLRIGIHSGDIVRGGPGDIFGDGINVASRIESICPPGAVLVSERVFEDLKNQVDLTVEPHGTFEFKNVDRPMKVYAVTRTGDRLLAEAPASAGRTGRARLPSGGEDRSNAVAVLPFANMSTDPENEFFSDGIAEEIINALTQVPGLKVTARTSSFSFKGQKLDVREIATRLEVGSILEGSVRRAGDRVRITAQLIDASTGYHIFSEAYDRVIADIFDTQDEIARPITRKLTASIPGKEPPPGSLVRTQTHDPAAHEAVLRGLYHFNRWFTESVRISLGHYQEAIRRDPDYALAHAGAAHCWVWLAGLASEGPDDASERARVSAERAVELDPLSPQAHLARADYLIFTAWDFEGGLEAVRKGLELAPGHALAHHMHAMYLRIRDRSDEAVVALETARALDPVSLPINNHLANALAAAGRLDEAIVQIDRTLRLDPGFTPAVEAAGWLQLQAGNLERATEVFDSLRRTSPQSADAISAQGFAYAVAGRIDEARACLAELEPRATAAGTGPEVEIARIQAVLGFFDEAMASLERAFRRKATPILFLHNSIRPWGGLRDDPRFKGLLERVQRGGD